MEVDAVWIFTDLSYSFFPYFCRQNVRLITQKEAVLSRFKTLAQRGLNYHDEPDQFEIPIIDSAYVTMPFVNNPGEGKQSNAIGCLELCMFSEGSRHQEEIIVTGTKVRFPSSIALFGIGTHGMY